MRRTRVVLLMLAVLGLCAYISLAAPAGFVRSLGHPIAYGNQPLPSAVPQSRDGHPVLTALVTLLVAIRTLHPQRYRAVEQWIHAQR